MTTDLVNARCGIELLCRLLKDAKPVDDVTDGMAVAWSHWCLDANT